MITKHADSLPFHDAFNRPARATFATSKSHMAVPSLLVSRLLLSFVKWLVILQPCSLPLEFGWAARCG